MPRLRHAAPLALLAVMVAGCGPPAIPGELIAPHVRVQPDKARYKQAAGGRIVFDIHIDPDPRAWRPDSIILKIFSNPEFTNSAGSYVVEERGRDVANDWRHSIEIPRRPGRYYCFCYAFKKVDRDRYDKVTRDNTTGDVCKLRSATVEVEVTP